VEALPRNSAGGKRQDALLHISEASRFGEAEHFASGDDEMIEEADLDER